MGASDNDQTPVDPFPSGVRAPDDLTPAPEVRGEDTVVSATSLPVDEDHEGYEDYEDDQLTHLHPRVRREREREAQSRSFVSEPSSAALLAAEGLDASELFEDLPDAPPPPPLVLQHRTRNTTTRRGSSARLETSPRTRQLALLACALACAAFSLLLYLLISSALFG